jgi:hypothetical protein
MYLPGKTPSAPSDTEVFPLPVAPMTLRQDLVNAAIKQACYVRNDYGRVGMWLLLGGDPAGLSRAHAVAKGKRTRGYTMKAMWVDPRPFIHAGWDARGV